MTTRHIYLGAIPFGMLQILDIVLVFFFPAIASWLPKAIGWQGRRRGLLLNL